MRRVVTYILLGLGVFAIALGLLLRVYAYPRLAKTPLDIDTTSVAQGSGVTALVYVPNGSSSTPEIRENLSLTSVTHVTGDLTQPEVKEDGDVSSWIEAARVTDDGSGLVVTASVRQMCLDRHTGASVVPCEQQYLQETDNAAEQERGSRNTVQEPGQIFKMPFDTEKKSYPWYDSSVKKSSDMKFDGEDNVKGLDVYRFVQEIPATKIDDRDVPGALIGKPDEATVNVGLYYETKRTIWVEPKTGAVIVGKEEGAQELRTSDQEAGQGTYVFKGTLQFNDKTVSKNVDEANKNTSKLWLLTGLPIILWIAGGLILLAGIVLLVLNRGAAGSHSEGSAEREPVASKS